MFEFVLENNEDGKNDVISIYYEKQLWAKVYRSLQGYTVKFYSHPKKEYWEFRVDEMLSSLEKARELIKSGVNK